MYDNDSVEFINVPTRSSRLADKSLDSSFEGYCLANIDTMPSEYGNAFPSSDTNIVFAAECIAESDDFAEVSLASFQKQCCGSMSLLQKNFNPSTPIRKEELDALNDLNHKHSLHSVVK